MKIMDGGACSLSKEEVMESAVLIVPRSPTWGLGDGPSR